MEYGETRREDQKKRKTHKKEDNETVRGDPLRDLPEWLEEFTENLLEKHNYKGSIQKTHWYSRAKSGNFW